uniref:ADP-ribosyl cyclase/cyclic ADP-ribose hydrolase n=1 Tax=Pyxicephalus adspersus TaxID=30357 RepID=A0AAV3AXD4_PYXAD|nr:TPA: hypothetical protein GDO54_009539 [Pyxicephalus adspersus]
MQILHCILGTLLLSICHLVQLNKAADRKWLGPGTTPNLEDIVIGRCYDYIATVNPSVGARNCSAIWAAFRSAFLSKDPCSVFPSDFELFINLTHHDIPANKVSVKQGKNFNFLAEVMRELRILSILHCYRAEMPGAQLPRTNNLTLEEEK